MANSSYLPRSLHNGFLSLAAVSFFALTLSGCGLKVKEKENAKGEKDVTIQSPVADMHIGKDVQGADTGISVYPGAKLVEKDDDGGSDRANFNISTALFGLKLVVVKYTSDDAPEKLVAFYTNDLKKYGKILECRKSGMGPDVKVSIDSDDKNPNELKYSNSCASTSMFDSQLQKKAS